MILFMILQRRTRRLFHPQQQLLFLLVLLSVQAFPDNRAKHCILSGTPIEKKGRSEEFEQRENEQREKHQKSEKCREENQRRKDRQRNNRKGK